jgi:Rieske Fe-S protein
MWLGLVSSYGTAAAFILRFLYPRRGAPALRSVYVMQFSDLPDRGVRTISDLRGAPVLLLRESNQVWALSLICTHLGCRAHWEPSRSRVFCPCHDGVFDPQGRVVSGPPPRPLDRYEVELLAGGVYLKMRQQA